MMKNRNWLGADAPSQFAVAARSSAMLQTAHSAWGVRSLWTRWILSNWPSLADY